MIRRAVVWALVCGLATGHTAQATVLDGAIVWQDGAGRFVVLDGQTGFSVGFDTFDDDNLYAFDEDQNIVLPADIRVDITSQPLGAGPGGVLAEGTIVASHYVFFDSLNGTQQGWIDFDAPVLGIAAYQDTMAATDFLANTKVRYISTDLRGLERGDVVWIDEDKPNRIWVSWAGSSPGDYIRVFTERSPAAMM